MVSQEGEWAQIRLELSDLDHSPIGNQINIVESRLGEVLSLEGLMTKEILYSTQDVQTWPLDSGAIFHVTQTIQLEPVA